MARVRATVTASSSAASLVSANGDHGSSPLHRTFADTLNRRSNDGSTALISVAAADDGGLPPRKQQATLRWLLRAGADLHAARDDGVTALLAAVAGGHADAVSAILEEEERMMQRRAAADDSSNGRVAADAKGKVAMEVAGSPATMAPVEDDAVHGREEQVQAQARQRRAVDAKLNDGSSALMMAADRGDMKTTRALLRAGATVDARAKEIAIARREYELIALMTDGV
jgi:ankyrin repeat protein